MTEAFKGRIIALKSTDKGGEHMEIQEREFAQRLARAASVLPDRKREYILGYAEGVLAMADQARNADQPLAAKDSA